MSVLHQLGGPGPPYMHSYLQFMRQLCVGGVTCLGESGVDGGERIGEGGGVGKEVTAVSSAARFL